MAQYGLDFQPYINTASGDLVGTVETTSQFSYDPSNFSEYMKAPIVGTFNIRFNSSITTLIKGTDDWNVIDRRMFTKFKYDTLNDEDKIDEYQWWKCYESKDVYEE
jgi:hypothetical protein